MVFPDVPHHVVHGFCDDLVPRARNVASKADDTGIASSLAGLIEATNKKTRRKSAGFLFMLLPVTQLRACTRVGGLQFQSSSGQLSLQYRPTCQTTPVCR